MLIRVASNGISRLARRLVLRKGDERLSGNHDGGDRKPDDDGAARPASSRKSQPRKDGIPRNDPVVRKDKASPIGRALRTVYDDMLRESVPDDFMDLLKKLD